MKKTFALIILSISTICGQNVYTYVGTGNVGATGDGGPAWNATTNSMMGLATDASGNLFIADAFNARIRKVNSSGIISTFGGNGTFGHSGDGGLATSAQLDMPICVAVDLSGNLYFTEQYYVRKISITGTITSIAGNGTFGYSGDGGPATSAQLNGPDGIAVDATGNVYVSDNGNNCIRMISPSGTITTIAGNGTAGFSGDGGPATAAMLNGPRSIFIDNSGNILICDEGNKRIRKISPSGTITTIAGNGNQGSAGDGGLATSAELYWPRGVCADNSGNIFISDFFNSTVRQINSSGVITKYAGVGPGFGFSGDGGPALLAQFYQINRVAIDNSGNVYVSDYNNNRTRVICPGSCLAGINDYNFKEIKLSLFPNPSNGSFTFQIDNDIKNGKLLILNLLGQTIYEQTVEQGDNKINLHRLTAGLYNYSLIQDKQIIKTGKLAID